jgi:hypothetical protein
MLAHWTMPVGTTKLNWWLELNRVSRPQTARASKLLQTSQHRVLTSTQSITNKTQAPLSSTDQGRREAPISWHGLNIDFDLSQ